VSVKSEHRVAKRACPVLEPEQEQRCDTAPAGRRTDKQALDFPVIRSRRRSPAQPRGVSSATATRNAPPGAAKSSGPTEEPRLGENPGTTTPNSSCSSSSSAWTTGQAKARSFRTTELLSLCRLAVDNDINSRRSPHERGSAGCSDRDPAGAPAGETTGPRPARRDRPPASGCAARPGSSKGSRDDDR
jgi:hypothetical protein